MKRQKKDENSLSKVIGIDGYESAKQRLHVRAYLTDSKMSADYGEQGSVKGWAWQARRLFSTYLPWPLENVGLLG